MAHFRCLCIDTVDRASDLATFWATVSGGTVTPAASGGPADVHGRAEHENLLVVPVPETKTVKNRVHLDAYALAIDDLTALGVEVCDNAEHGGGWWTLLGATPDPVLTFDFVPVPEPKTVKNRVHWDIRGNVEELLERGATHLWDRPLWTVLADPEGNEFCVLPEQ